MAKQEAPAISGLTAVEAYTAIFEWLRSQSAVEYLEEHAKEGSALEEPLRLVEALPDPARATPGEMRVVFREVITGYLEWFYAASDGRATMSEYAKVGQGALEGDSVTPAEASELIKSRLLPALSQPHQIFDAYQESDAASDPVMTLDTLTEIYARISNAWGPEIWSPLIENAAGQTFSEPDQWGARYEHSLERLVRRTEHFGREKDVEAYAAYLTDYRGLARETSEAGTQADESVETSASAETGDGAADERAVEGSPDSQGSKEAQPAQASDSDEAEQDADAAAVSFGALAPAYLTDALGTEATLEEVKLGIERDVRAISTVMTNENWGPPLAVGLFGRWGSGKSFFMNQVQWQVKRLAAASRKAAREGAPGPLCRRPVQIPFSAWHYIDANLWASLVVRIFDQLAAELSPGPTDEAKQNALIAELVTYKNLKQEAIERRERAQAQLELAQVEATRARSRVQVAEELLRAADALGIVNAKDVDKLASNLLKRFGIVRSLLGTRAGLLRLSAFAAFGLLLLLFGGDLGELGTNFEAIKKLGLGALTAISGWQLISRSRLLNVTAKAVESSLEVTQAPEDSSLPDSRLFDSKLFDPADARGTVSRLEQDLARITTRETELTDRYQQIQREIDDLSPRRRLARLIEERASEDSTYRRAEGLVSMIREDFRELEKTLARLHRNGQADLSGEDFPIDRIILYIDDLDRCPADRVAEVLQAVHLLLGFEIFVVVVAVDPRWLLKSLEKHYPELLSSESGGADGGGSATPRDYLEKIFQIPYTIPLMRAEDSFEYIEYLLERGETVTHQARAAGETDRAEHTAAASDERIREPAAGDPATSQTVTAAAEEEDEPAQQIDEDDRRTQQHEEEAQLAEGVDPAPATLELSATEIKLIKALGPIFRTPRAGKRFVNVYRILRVTIEPDELDEYVRDHCHGVLLLLASALEYPEVGVHLLLNVRRGDGKKAWNLFIGDLTPDDLPGIGDHALRQLDRLKARTAGLEKIGKANMRGLGVWAERVARYTFGN